MTDESHFENNVSWGYRRKNKVNWNVARGKKERSMIYVVNLG